METPNTVQSTASHGLGGGVSRLFIKSAVVTVADSPPVHPVADAHQCCLTPT